MPYRKLVYLLSIVMLASFLSGCATKPPQDTKTPQQTIGVLDMEKAVKAHPRWSQLDALHKKINTINLQAQQRVVQKQPEQVQPQELQQGLDAYLSQEYEAKLAVKQAELKVVLDEKTAALRQEISSEYQAYMAELEKSYQPRLFSLQLKMKTLQMNKEEMASLQQEIEKLQSEQDNQRKIKEEQLSARMETAIAPQKAELEQQLSLYAHNLENELAEKRAQQTSQPSVTLPAGDSQLQDSPQGSDNADIEIKVLNEQITVLEDLIIGDIQDITAKIAAQQGLELVLTNIDTNISAQDVTNQVIAEFKK